VAADGPVGHAQALGDLGAGPLTAHLKQREELEESCRRRDHEVTLGEPLGPELSSLTATLAWTDQGAVEEAMAVTRVMRRGTTIAQAFWPSRIELNRAATPPGPANRLILRIGAALAAWGGRPRSGAGRDIHLQAHEERMAVISAMHHGALPLC